MLELAVVRRPGALAEPRRPRRVLQPLAQHREVARVRTAAEDHRLQRGMLRAGQPGLQVDHQVPVGLDALLVGVGGDLELVEHHRGRLQVLLLGQLHVVEVAGDALGVGPGVLARLE